MSRLDFDALFGEGGAAELKTKLEAPGFDPPDIDFIRLPNGNVRVNVRWGEAQMKIECSPTNVHFLTLNSGSDVPTGLYTALCNRLPALFKRLGVVTFSCSPADKPKEDILRTRGGWDATMKWRI